MTQARGRRPRDLFGEECTLFGTFFPGINSPNLLGLVHLRSRGGGEWKIKQKYVEVGAKKLICGGMFDKFFHSAPPQDLKWNSP